MFYSSPVTLFFNIHRRHDDDSFFPIEIAGSVTCGAMVLSALDPRLTFSRDEREGERERDMMPLEPFTRNAHITPGSREPPLDFNGTNVAKPHRRPSYPRATFNIHAISTMIIPQNLSGAF